MNTKTDQYTTHSTLKPVPTLPRWWQIATTGMYIIHYSAEHIAFSAEIHYQQQL